jgi:hypothetical protein
MTGEIVHFPNRKEIFLLGDRRALFEKSLPDRPSCTKRVREKSIQFIYIYKKSREASIWIAEGCQYILVGYARAKFGFLPK